MDTEIALNVVSGLLRAMSESENPDDLCDFLANSVLADFDVVATYLAVLDSDGRVSMVGSWGYPASRRSPEDRPSLWYPMAITDTIRTGRIHVYESWDDYVAKYPHLTERAAPGKSFVCVPFSDRGRRTGGLGLTFGRELSKVTELEGLWEVLAQAGGLFVSRSWAGGVFKQNAFSSQQPVDEAALRSSLTKRDLQVLRMTAQGSTVGQIARELNFSESTIKQTRMALYKKLGVRRAADLPHAMAALGIDAN